MKLTTRLALATARYAQTVPQSKTASTPVVTGNLLVSSALPAQSLGDTQADPGPQADGVEAGSEVGTARRHADVDGTPGGHPAHPVSPPARAPVPR